MPKTKNCAARPPRFSRLGERLLPASCLPTRRRQRARRHDDAAAFRDAIRKEESLLVVFGQDFRGGTISALVNFGATQPDVEFACLGDYVDSRGAADIGPLPRSAVPGYVPYRGRAVSLDDTAGVAAAQPGLDLLPMFDAAASGSLAALLVVGADTVDGYRDRCRDLRNTFIIAQDMFLTATAQLASVIFPASNLGKSGTVPILTATCGW